MVVSARAYFELRFRRIKRTRVCLCIYIYTAKRYSLVYRHTHQREREAERLSFARFVNAFSEPFTGTCVYIERMRGIYLESHPR